MSLFVSADVGYWFPMEPESRHPSRGAAPRAVAVAAKPKVKPQRVGPCGLLCLQTVRSLLIDSAIGPGVRIEVGAHLLPNMRSSFQFQVSSFSNCAL